MLIYTDVVKTHCVIFYSSLSLVVCCPIMTPCHYWQSFPPFLGPFCQFHPFHHLRHHIDFGLAFVRLYCYESPFNPLHLLHITPLHTLHYWPTVRNVPHMLFYSPFRPLPTYCLCNNVRPAHPPPPSAPSAPVIDCCSLSESLAPSPYRFKWILVLFIYVYSSPPSTVFF